MMCLRLPWYFRAGRKKKKKVILFFFTCHKPIKLMSVPFKILEIRIRKELRGMNTSKGVGFIVVDKGCIL